MNPPSASTPLHRVTNRGSCTLALLLAAAWMAFAQAQDTAPLDLRYLHDLSADLVARAQSGTADATRFRIDATLYRESLRRLMLQDTPEPGPRELLLDMVRMAALLNAAAECKTGRYITCPAELMRQLIAQQSRLDAHLSALPEGRAG